jgi:pullulanase/glycogen debranching enzyme
MVADSLRYWATEMRVDGFRFDLATILARELSQGTPMLLAGDWPFTNGSNNA